jgi:uncharacterized protein
MTTDPNQIGLFRVFSAVLERAGLTRRLEGDSAKRNLDDILRRKKDLAFKDFFTRYDRKDIAGRIVDAYPDATWRKPPVVTEDKEADDTPLEAAYKRLERRLRANSYFSRVDRLAGLGRYAVLLIGTKGGSSLSTPLKKGQFTAESSIIYLSVFGEDSATIKTYVTDSSDERFGKPNTYELNFGSSVEGFVGEKKREVHWTRVIHVAEDLLEDEVHGRPRLKRVFDLLEDLEKVVGGAAEMFYQGADKGLHLDVRDEYALTDEDKAAVKEQLELYKAGLERVLRTQGITSKELGGTTADPTGPASVILDLIAGTTGIPKRMLLGSERGELASTTDETTFIGHVKERQVDHAEPVILRAFIDRLIWLGALPEPKVEEGYSVEWPSLFERSDTEKVAMAKDLATANRLMPGLVSPEEVRTKYLGFEAATEAEEEGEDTAPEGSSADEAEIPTVQDIVEAA